MKRTEPSSTAASRDAIPTSVRSEKHPGQGPRGTGFARPQGPSPRAAGGKRRQARRGENRLSAISSRPSKIRLSTSSQGVDMLGAIFQPAPPVM